MNKLSMLLWGVLCMLPSAGICESVLSAEEVFCELEGESFLLCKSELLEGDVSLNDDYFSLFPVEYELISAPPNASFNFNSDGTFSYSYDECGFYDFEYQVTVVDLYDEPQPEVCHQGVETMTIIWYGASNIELTVSNKDQSYVFDVFPDVQYGDIIYITNDSGNSGGQYNNWRFLVDGQFLCEVHTSCSIPLLGLTFCDYIYIAEYASSEGPTNSMFEYITCDAEVEIEIPEIDADAGPDQNYCSGSEVTLEASGGEEYLWSTGETTVGIEVRPSGNVSYYVTVTDGNGCSEIDTVSLFELQPVDIEIAPQSPLCIDTEPVQLTATPSGGTFSGPGVEGEGYFDPSAAGVGNHKIYYMFTDENQCTGIDSITIVVNALPAVDIASVADLCVDSDNIQLVGTPSGGTFSGNTVDPEGTFDPSAAGVGNHKIYYTFLDQDQCEGTDSITIVVNPLPEVSIEPVADVCIDSEVVQLQASPAGGSFSGNGVDPEGAFDPSAVGVGNHKLYYMYTDENQCTGIDSITIFVNALPTVDIEPVSDLCIDAEPVQLTATPSGGTFSGPGVEGDGYFDPSAAGVGNHKIYYVYTDENQCTGIDSITIVVNALPAVDIASVADLCVDSDNIQLVGTPSGGTFSGNTVDPEGTFDPSAAGVGNHKIYYTFLDQDQCEGTDSITIVVNPLPEVSIEPVADVCIDSEVVQLQASPAGGSFSGNGVDQEGTFDPSAAGVGNHKLYYMYTDENQCTGIDSITIFVNALPTVDIEPVSDLCIDTEPVQLTATPSGGTFSGPGVEGEGYFDPSAVGVGNHKIYYVYTDENQCTGIDSITIVVNALPAVDIASVADLCVDSDNIQLVGTPSGGTFSGNTVDPEGTFDPSAAGVGNHKIYYTFLDQDQCEGTDSITIVVNPLPEVSIEPVADVCIDSEVVQLQASPAGGSFSGNGVDPEGAFDPSAAGVGNHKLYYMYADENQCTGIDSITIFVNALPTVDIEPVSDLCIDAEPVQLTATPSGGTFSGKGVNEDGNFDPSAAGVGNHKIYYMFTDENQCTGIDSITIVVNALPAVDIASVADLCVDSDNIQLVGTPSGGTFSGNTVDPEGTFDPSAAGVGNHKIYYTFLDQDQCEGTDSITIVVNPLPEVSIEPVADVCIDSEVVQLQASPAGGSFSGNGVDQEGTFDPSAAGVGNHKIFYTYTDPNQCTGMDSITIVVNPLPDVSIEPITDVCIDSEAIQLLASPVGGTFAGNGVERNGVFDPSAAGIGNHKIYYTYTDLNQCTATDSITIAVIAIPSVDIGSVDDLCIDSEPVQIVVSPEGGVFTGSGVDQQGIFDPSDAGTGTHKIIYTYQDSHGCTGSDSIMITVNGVPVVQIESVEPMCVDADAIQLEASPVGGIYLGPGISNDGSFDPSLAGVGVHEIIYSIVDNNQCQGNDTIDIVVLDLPLVTLEGQESICIYADAIQLIGSPPGGAFYGNVGPSGVFNPEKAGLGTHEIIYQYEDHNGCNSTAELSITVYPQPEVSISEIDPLCLRDGSVQFNGNPQGGIFSGDHISPNGLVNLSLMEPGIHEVTYTYIDENLCANSATTEFEILPNSVIGNFVWNDVNQDGCQDIGELGINGIELILYSSDNIEIARVITSNHPQSGDPGFYEFLICYGNYYVQLSTNDYQVSPKNNCNDMYADSDADPVTGRTDVFTVDQGVVIDHIDFGLNSRCFEIGGEVWYDLNEDDMKNNGENGINGLPVSIWKKIGDSWEYWDDTYTGPRPNTPSDDGYYKFCVPAGEYYISFFMPENGLVSARPHIGPDKTIDSDVTDYFGRGTTDVIIVNNEVDKTYFCDIDAGYYPMATAGDNVWVDVDGNGLREIEEPAMAGVVVEAFNLFGEKVAETISDEYGRYRMEYLKKDAHFLKFTPPDGFGFTFSDPGDNNEENIDSDVDHSNGPNTTQFYMMRPGIHTPNIDAGLSYAVLPVEWAAFSGYNQGTINLLEWSTASEVNTSHFEVMRRSPGQADFVEIGSIEAAGESKSFKEYEFVDSDINRTGYYYYKLKQMDVNGLYTYSDIIKIDVTQDIVEEVTLFPNPAIDVLNISNAESVTEIEMYDIKGNHITTYGKSVIGNARLDIEMINGSGMYLFKIKTISGGSLLKNITILKN